MNKKEIGEMIRVMRVSRNMNQSELAEAVGVSPAAIAMYESGKRKPSDIVAEAMADVFNVPKWSIYYTEEEMIPKEDTDKINIQMTPRTEEGKILANGVDRLPPKERQRALEIMQVTFREYGDFFGKGVNKDEEGT